MQILQQTLCLLLRIKVLFLKTEMRQGCKCSPLSILCWKIYPEQLESHPYVKEKTKTMSSQMTGYISFI